MVFPVPSTRWRVALSVLLAIVAAGCGMPEYPQHGAVTGPSNLPPLQLSLAGTYVGRFSHGAGSFSIRVRLQQSGTALTGTWINDDGTVHGTLSGTLTATSLPAPLSLRWTWDGPANDGSTRCVGAMTANGSALPIVLSSSALTFDNCAGTLNQVRIAAEIYSGSL